MPTWRILLLSLAFLGAVGLAMWVVTTYDSSDDRKGAGGYKKLSGTVAEGFVYRSGRESHPRVTCSACRVGKLKVGLVSLGAFNAIEFDDLVVNIPESIGCEKTFDSSEIERGKKTETDAVVQALNLKPVMAMARVEAKKFTGIRISKLQINKMTSKGLKPILAADVLKNSGRRLVLRNVVLHKDDHPLSVSEAELKINPGVCLVWRDGSWDLTKLLEPML